MKLKELRKRKNLSQNDVAKFLGIKQATYSGYESEKFEPKIETLCKLADFYNVSLDYLIGRVKENSNLENELFNLIGRISEVGKGKIIGYSKKILEEENTKNRKK